MKFTSESLIEIYLNGSFTEEAQSEFDKLMRKDAAFAERVTQAIAERVGPAPDSLEGISTNLDSKIEGLWQSHKPSPYGQALKKAVQVAIVLAAAGGLYGGFKHYWTNYYAANNEEGTVSSITDGSSSHEVNGESGSPAGAQSGSVTSANSNQKSTSKKTSKNHKKGQGLSSNSTKLPAAVGTNLSTPLPVQKSDDRLAQDNPTLSGSKGNGAQGAVGSSTEKYKPSIVSAPQTEEGDALRVSIETDKRQNVVVTVLDSNGLLVRHLYQGQWNAGVHLVDWDGKDEIGNSVLPGNYTILLNADGKTQSGTVAVKPNQ